LRRRSALQANPRSTGEAVSRRVSGCDGETLRDAEMQHAVGQFGGEGAVVEIAAETEAQFVVPLGVFEVGGGEVDADDMALASDDDEVGTADHDFDPGGVDSRQKDGEFDGVALVLAIVVRAACFAEGGDDAALATIVGQRGRKDRVHGGRMGRWIDGGWG